MKCGSASHTRFANGGTVENEKSFLDENWKMKLETKKRRIDLTNVALQLVKKY